MVNVKNFGAAGDGVTDDTAAIQAALDTGEVVCFPAGIYNANTIYLRSNGGVHLEEGAVLRAIADKNKCNPDDFPPPNRVFAREHVSGAHFIIGYECENLSFSGKGTIDGNFKAVFDTGNVVGLEGSHPHYEYPEWRMAQMIFFCCCRNIEMKDIRLENAQYWNCFFHGCENIHVDNVTIRGDHLVMNTDGIDIDCCRHVLIENCDIDTGDDCVTARGNTLPLGGEYPCEDVEVRNCRFVSVTCGIRVGVGQGEIRNCYFHDIDMRETHIGIGICPSFRAGTCCLIEKCVFENITFEGLQPLLLIPCWMGVTETDNPNIRPVRDLVFRNFKAEGRRPVQCLGSNDPEMFKDIRFENFSVKLLEPVLPPLPFRWPKEEFGVFNIANFPALDLSGIHAEAEGDFPPFCRL
jgi:polygalacturonase